MTSVSRTQAMLLAALCAAVLWLYLPVWHGEFVYDDIWFIVRNPFMHQPLSWTSLFTDSRVTAAPASGLSTDVYRPLTTLSFWADAHLWGPDTFPYHLENLLLHIANGLLLFVLLRRWMGDFRGALMGSAVFLLHPVQVQSVAWITQCSSLASTTCLLAALIYLTGWSKSPNRGRRITGIAWAAAALLFRETPVVFPLLYGSVVSAYRKLSWGEIWRNRSTRTVLLALSGVAALYLGVRQGILHQWSQLPEASGSWTTNIGLGVLAFPVYLGKILLPLKLRANYAYPELDPVRLAFAGFAVLIFIALAVYALRRDRWLATGLLWILICLLPVLQIVPIRAFVAERFLYLPMVGIAIIACRLGAFPAGRRLCVLWLLFLTGLTWQAVPAWKNEASLWAEAVKQEPDNVFARLCYGDALRDPDAAYQQYRYALLNHPNVEQHFLAVNNLANVLLQQGKNRQALLWARKAVAQNPQSPEALYNLTQAASRTGHRGEAMSALGRLEKVAGPNSPPVRNLRQEMAHRKLS